jgi:hypothetical protein
MFIASASPSPRENRARRSGDYPPCVAKYRAGGCPKLRRNMATNALTLA